MKVLLRSVAFLAAMLAVSVGAYANAGTGDPGEAAARAAAMESSEVASVLASHPDAQLIGGPTDAGGWSFEIVAEDVELGFVVLSVDLEVVEVGLVDGGVSSEEADEGAENGDRRPLAELLIPGADGSAVFLWITLGVVLFIVWPGSRSRGRALGHLLATALVLWGVSWLVFWTFVDTSQLVMWTTNLVVLTAVSVAMWRGRIPRFEGRGERRVVILGLTAVLLWLVWLALSGSVVEDSTIWAARGGRYLVDNLAFPYGVLGEGATYGPILYLLHTPLTVLWPPGEFGADSFLAARIVAAGATVALGIGAIAALGWRTSRAYAGAIAVLILPWFVSVVDAANVSHLVPIAFTVWAFVLVSRESDRSAAIGGALLGLGAGAMFVPAFAAPALLLAARDRWRLALGGMVVVGLAVLAPLLLTGAGLSTVWNDTVRFQETAYSAEAGLSFWGRFALEDWRWVGKVLHVGLLSMSVGGLYRYRGQAAGFLAAGVGIGGVLLWKGHVGPWGYLTWFVPLLVIGALLAGEEEPTPKMQPATLP